MCKKTYKMRKHIYLRTSTKLYPHKCPLTSADVTMIQPPTNLSYLLLWRNKSELATLKNDIFVNIQRAMI